MDANIIGATSVAAAAMRLPAGSGLAEIDTLNNAVHIMSILTGKDSTTLLSYLQRRAAESPAPAVETWRGIVGDAQSGALDLTTIDWSA